MAIDLDPNQVNALNITERVMSILSLLGILFILSTYYFGRRFDKPINRLIFFASWSNLGMNVASLIAEDGPAAGQDSPTCQFQAWAIQMFLGVDVFWALCMSLNVYLALFRGWSAEKMRKLDLWYFIGCYGAAFIPAIAYLGVATHARGRVYGPALLWCWITSEWDFLRVATLYGIVWVAIGSAFGIYVLASVKAYRNRHALTGLFNPLNEDPFGGQIPVTTEIEIVTESIESAENGRKASSSPPKDGHGARIPGIEEHHGSHDIDPYSINIEADRKVEPIGRKQSQPDIGRLRSLTREMALQEINHDAWLYARVAFLFFCALLISWIPSSINRVYSLAHPDRLVFGLNYVEALVLPLQGFWNCAVYMVSSKTAVRNLFRSLRGLPELSPRNPKGANGDLESMGGARDSKKGMSMGMGRVAAGINKAAKGDGKMDRFVSRRASQSQNYGRERLESGSSSITSLTPTHHR